MSNVILDDAIARIYRMALSDAVRMLADYPDLEIRSALKQAASDRGVEYGKPMAQFVRWAEREILHGSE
jgi:hypothetical protein